MYDRAPPHYNTPHHTTRRHATPPHHTCTAAATEQTLRIAWKLSPRVRVLWYVRHVVSRHTQNHLPTPTPTPTLALTLVLTLALSLFPTLTLKLSLEL